MVSLPMMSFVIQPNRHCTNDIICNQNIRKLAMNLLASGVARPALRETFMSVFLRVLRVPQCSLGFLRVLLGSLEFLRVIQGILNSMECRHQGFFADLKPMEISTNDTNIICSSLRNTLFLKIGRVWLKKQDCHTHFNFELSKGVAGYIFELHPSNFQKSCIF